MDKQEKAFEAEKSYLLGCRMLEKTQYSSGWEKPCGMQLHMWTRATFLQGPPRPKGECRMALAFCDYLFLCPDEKLVSENLKNESIWGITL